MLVFFSLCTFSSVIHPRFLSFVVKFIFFCGGRVSLFVSILVFIVFFAFDSVRFLYCILSFCDKKRQHQITESLQFWFWSSASVLASSHFHLAQNRKPTRRREQPLKMVFVSLLVLVTMFWNIYLYRSFEHNPKFPQKCALKKRQLFTPRQKKRCFRNGRLRKMETLMLTRTNNWILKQKQR